MKQYIKPLFVAGLLATSVYRCNLKNNQEIIQNRIALSEVLEKRCDDHLISVFLSHLMELHTKECDNQDAEISFDNRILTIETIDSIKLFTITDFNFNEACQIIVDFDSIDISGKGGEIDGDNHSLSAAALYFDMILFSQQGEEEREYRKQNDPDKNLINQQDILVM